MNSREDVDYRLKLAKGFLKEAQEDFQLKRWRSCVANAQLSVENSGKAILMAFGVSPKTHEPAKHLSKLIQKSKIPEEIKARIEEIIPDYGDESAYKLPWDIFDKKSAKLALNVAQSCKSASDDIASQVFRLRRNKN
jgi:HEPN domain-containing protein